MKRRRVEGSAGVYHCIMRTAGGQRLLEAGDKEVLRRMLWKVAAFSAVEVLAYCVLSNHYHVLVRVADREEVVVSREELLRRYGALYQRSGTPGYPDAQQMELVLGAGDEAALRWEARLRARMEDVSAFMKTLNQRFSVWYNRTHGRFGTLWAARFKSVIVQNDPVCLQTVAAYIDLNPVRAGLVTDPGDYRWSSYGEAMGGGSAPQGGLAQVVGQRDWKHAVADYRMVLFGKGYHGREGEQCGIPREKVLEVLSQGGKVPLRDLLRCRLRYMTEGVALGSRAFVEGLADAQRARAGTSRKTHPQSLPATDVSVISLRNLQKTPVR